MAGNIKIIAPKDNYQKVAKNVIFNDRVDPLTLGIYVKVLCLGEKWELNIKGLASVLHISADKVRASFAILEETGYLRRTRVQGAKGHFLGWDYEISSEPLTDIDKTPTSEKTESRKSPTSENCPVINRDNKPVNKDSSLNIIPPTPQAVADYVRNMVKDPEGFALYYTTSMAANEWMRGKGKDRKPVTNWKNNVLQWVKYHKNEDFSYLKPVAQKGSTVLSTEAYNKMLNN